MKTNSLKHKIEINNNTTNAVINIRLDDECKNGHQDFSITATFYQPNKSRYDRNMIFGGCCHDEILKILPELSIFVKLHLCDFKGAPMHASANAFYHIKRETKEKFQEYYNFITDEEYKTLLSAESEEVFKYYLFNLGIVYKWEKLAKEGIKTLERLTGNEFINDSKRSQLEPLTNEDFNRIKKGIEDGFYSAENIEARAEEKKKVENKAIIDKLKADASKQIEAIRKELNLKVWLNSKGISLENCIYYKHSKTLTFNWLDYKDTLSEEDFNKLCNNLTPKDYEVIDGIILELKGVKTYARV